MEQELVKVVSDNADGYVFKTRDQLQPGDVKYKGPTFKQENESHERREYSNDL